MLFLFLFLLDVHVTPCNATIAPHVSCTSFLPLDVADITTCNVIIAPFVSSTCLHPHNVVVTPPPNWCFPPFHVFASMGERTSIPIQFVSSFKLLQAKLKGEFFFFLQMFVYWWILFFVLIVHIFLGNFGWHVCLLCARIIWTLCISFYTSHFNFTNYISFYTFSFCIFSRPFFFC